MKSVSWKLIDSLAILVVRYAVKRRIRFDTIGLYPAPKKALDVPISIFSLKSRKHIFSIISNSIAKLSAKYSTIPRYQAGMY